MEYTIVIQQLVLHRWIKTRSVDLFDAALVSFVRNLNPDDPAVARHMLNGYYRLNLQWILDENPLFHVTTDWISRRLHKLSKLGLLDLYNVREPGRPFKLYGRLSKLYFKAEAAAKEAADRAASESPKRRKDKTPTGEKSHGTTDRSPAEKTPNDHKDNDHEEGSGTAPSGGADAKPPQVETKEQALERLPFELKNPAIPVELDEQQAAATRRFKLDLALTKRRQKRDVELTQEELILLADFDAEQERLKAERAKWKASGPPNADGAG